MTEKKPRVSIGMPVYNAERFLEQALDGILAQTFTDFEVVISDNGSTDSTQAICQRYAAQDPRIRYHRLPSNIGVSRNFNRVFELSSGEYFKWCAHDDIPKPTFLEKCVAVLDQRPEVVMCYTKGIDIDESGMELRYFTYTLDLDSPDPVKRFHDMTLYEHPMLTLFGVIRSDALRRAGLMEHYPVSDRILMGRYALLGRIYRIPEYLHLNREYPGRSVKKYGDSYRLMAMYNPEKAGKTTFPNFAMLWGYIRAIFAYPLSLRQRIGCLRVLWQWAYPRERKFRRDISRAIKKPLRPLYHKLRPSRRPPIEA
ncbi:MAG: glycosyltransferase family 2 protein [Anaerolineae bacterium]|nr:glycosyltransferase family 2 protein [Anaerolineae bacterium]